MFVLYSVTTITLEESSGCITRHGIVHYSKQGDNLNTDLQSSKSNYKNGKKENKCKQPGRVTTTGKQKGSE